MKTFFAIQFEGEILSAKLNGSEIVSGTTTSLSAGVHKLSLALNAINGDHEHITIRASVVPVPAAIWLFGSALMGLVGVSRRKVSGLAA